MDREVCTDPCGDGNACTTGDTCSPGLCKGVAPLEREEFDYLQSPIPTVSQSKLVIMTLFLLIWAKIYFVKRCLATRIVNRRQAWIRGWRRKTTLYSDVKVGSND